MGAIPSRTMHEAGGTPDARPRRSLPVALLVEARPKQWVKNLLVFAAPAAAGVLGRRTETLAALAAFGCFCLASIATYYLNDAADVEADRRHPIKRHRPIAAGEIPLLLARIMGGAGVIAAVGLSALVDSKLALVIGLYLLTTTVYSHWLKHLPVFDVVGVATGFVLRAIAGGIAADVPISNWFFIVASFGSLFMVVGKRRSELAEMGGDAGDTRRVLDGYPPGFLARMQTTAVSVVLIGYCVWAFEKAEVAGATEPWFQLSIVPFALAIFRYALLIDAGEGGAPEDVVLRDRTLLLLGVLWAVVFTIGVYR